MPNILLLGTLPETAGIGGVTIHIKRLKDWLDKNGITYDFCDYKTLPIIQQFKQIANHKVVHIHISHPLARAIYILYSRLVGTKSMLTIHGNIGRFSWFKNLMDQLSIRLCNVPILINSQSFERAKKWNKNSIKLSAFIPPIEEGYLPQYVTKKIENVKKEGKIIIASNASVMSFTDSGEEIYGINFAINYFRDKPKYFLCISDASGQYQEKYKNQSLENILFITEPHSFYKLMMLCDIMIRPTATDGDALSVKEGLYLRKKVIATDRVDRPEGVILFHYNDAESLSKALHSQITYNNNLEKEQVINTLINIFNKLNQ